MRAPPASLDPSLALLASRSLRPPRVGAGCRDSPPTKKPPRRRLRASSLVTDPNGTLNFKLYATIRYLNQTAIDDTYTDAFGTTTHVDPGRTCSSTR